jgi:uncharacterized membrane protein
VIGPDELQSRRAYRTNRLEAFSDGVFAIAITLLVLEISVPSGAEKDLLAAVLAQWPSYLAFVVSFATIGATWLAHSTITEYLDHVDGTFSRLNLLLLLVVSFIPFPTRLLAEHTNAADAERVASTFYGITLMLAAVLISVLWRYAARAKLIKPDFSDEDVQILSERLTPGIGGYVVIIVIGLIAPLVAVVGYLLVALFFLIPFPLPGERRRRARRGHGPGPGIGRGSESR